RRAIGTAPPTERGRSPRRRTPRRATRTRRSASDISPKPDRSALLPIRTCGAFPSSPCGERRGETASAGQLRRSPRPRRTRRRKRTKGCSRAPKEAYVGVLMRANRGPTPDIHRDLAWCYHVARLTHLLVERYGADLPPPQYAIST